MNGWLCSVLLLALAGESVGCGGDSSPAPPAPIDPATFCPAECERRLDADCQKFPPDYQNSCEAGCLYRYTTYPACRDQIEAVDRCIRDRISYTCTASGTLQSWPSGAGAYEAQSCQKCTNDPYFCGF